MDMAVEQQIQTHSEALARLLKSKFEGRPVLSSWQALKDYLHASLVSLPVEEVRVMFLDTKNHLIADETHSRGTVNECPIHIREVIHRALNLGACALILAHNHPSGDPTPSSQDIRFTRDLIDACKHLGIYVHDHIIIAGAAEPVSMKAGGYIG